MAAKTATRARAVRRAAKIDAEVSPGSLDSARAHGAKASPAFCPSVNKNREYKYSNFLSLGLGHEQMAPRMTRCMIQLLSFYQTDQVAQASPTLFFCVSPGKLVRALPWNHVRFPTPYVEASMRKLSKIHETMPAAHRGKAARGSWFVQKQYTNRNRNLLRACWPNSSTMERRL